ncbi:MAG: N-acetylmuramoyl-L-alanine amidase [Vicinamibacteria bacterium]
MSALAGLALPAPLEAARPRRAPAKKAAAAPRSEARPDRALYTEAQQALATLKASPARAAKRPEWERVALKFQSVVARYPQSAYCDDALLTQGDIYRNMAARFKSARYGEQASDAYRMLVAEYPSSRHADDALFAVLELAQASGEEKRVAEAARAYLAAFPRSARASAVKAQLKKRAPVQAASLPQPPPPGLAQVFNLRFWSGEASTRVVIDVERKVPLKHDRIEKPDRLWIDLDGAHLHPNLTDRAFPVGDGLLEQVRIGQNRDRVVRVVLDFKDVKDHQVFYLDNPTRLVIDVNATPKAKMASAAPTAPVPYDGPEAPAVTATPSPTPSPAAVASLPRTPPASPTPTPGVERVPSRRLPALSTPGLPAEPTRTAARTPVVIEGTERAAAPPPAPAPARSETKTPVRTARSEPVPPAAPIANRAGTFSLARQLGLSARRIVIDAGHGGHDPGSIGAGGYQEKDLVLDVALRLEKLVRSELGAEVVMTRGTDVFIPLEERTGIANAKGADLFLSIHANASRNRKARGIETYFLNFAKNAHAEEVAARENSISPATLKDLGNLVKAITTNSKIDESRDFAHSVQEAMIESLAPDGHATYNRGVHTAPFYVLIGASMPSILAEIAFVSNPEEEKLLRTPERRQEIARSLLDGVRAYLFSLNRTQPVARGLTPSRGGSRVGSRGGRR